MNLIILIVLCLCSAALILAVFNSIYLHAVSGRTAELEQEINKKAQEFDNFKKEKQAAIQNKSIIPAADVPLADIGETVYSNEPIQIMRNVHGSFKEAEKLTIPVEHHFADKAAPHPSDHGSTLPDPLNDPIPPNVDYPELYSNNEPDIMATVSENSFGYTATDEPAIIKLYSESAKDADFNYLWKTVSEHLQSQNTAAIYIDFTGINFIYEKEIQYLLRIYHIALTAGINITFINCDPELISLFNQYEQLQHLIQKKDL